MKDIDRANILDGLVIEIVFGKVEKSGVEKPSFWGGDIIISPPGTDRVNTETRLNTLQSYDARNPKEP